MTELNKTGDWVVYQETPGGMWYWQVVDVLGKIQTGSCYTKSGAKRALKRPIGEKGNLFNDPS